MDIVHFKRQIKKNITQIITNSNNKNLNITKNNQ